MSSPINVDTRRSGKAQAQMMVLDFPFACDLSLLLGKLRGERGGGGVGGGDGMWQECWVIADWMEQARGGRGRGWVVMVGKKAHMGEGRAPAKTEPGLAM